MHILYEDSQIIVCYKEAGLPVQSARIGTKDLESSLKNYLGEQTGKLPYLAVVHRLDQPVEGVLAFAKTKKAAASLSAQVQDGRMKKTYQAVVQIRSEHTEGEQAKKGILMNMLLRDGKTNTSRIVPEHTKGAKKAVLEYQILADKWNMDQNRSSDDTKNSRIALVQIQLHTGRHHQIRVQMAGAGMPLLGDRKYGQSSGADSGKAALALCAVSLELIHPKTGKKMQFTCEPQGEYFKEF